MSVGQEKYFYEVNLLSDEEYKFIQRFLFNGKRPELQDTVSLIIDCFHIPTKFNHIVSALNSDSDPEAQRILNELKVGIHEKLLSSMENMAQKFMPLLRNGDISFLADDTNRNLFMLHLCFQYLRTKRMKAKILATDISRINEHYNGRIKLENLWGVISVAYAFQVGIGIFALLPKYHFRLIHNDSAVHFITGDQPVINIADTGRPLGQAPTVLEFYQPISPTVALFMSRRFDSDSSVNIDDDEMTEEYNRVIASEALEQIYGSSEMDVSKYTIGPNNDVQGTRHKWRVP